MYKTAKEIILERIRKGLNKVRFRDNLNEIENHEEIFFKSEKSLPKIFHNELTKINGECHYFDTENKLNKIFNG